MITHSGNGKILEVQDLTKAFGGLLAVNKVDFHVDQGEILGMIGPNGAGKTTAINVISGFYPATEGKVIFNGKDISKHKAYQISKLGMGRNFQTSLLFMPMPAIANVFFAFHNSYKTNIFARLLRLPIATREENSFRMKSMEIMQKLGIAQYAFEMTKNLPYGYQRILSVCVALATHPSLLLLDEPVTGMNQTEIDTMLNIIRQLRDSGITIVMIEHNMPAVMSLCDRIVVLDHGQKIAEGSPKEIQCNEQVIEAYLGKE